MDPEQGQPQDSDSPLETMTASPLVRPRPDRSIASDQLTTIRLEVVGGPMDGISAHKTGDLLTIGRDPESDIALPLDPLVSTHHARIVREGGVFWLEDLGSRNGSYIGEQRVEGRIQVAPGTLLVLGSTCLEFVPA
jgi:pSer/pThr/pTyr-binding forkhead associated (FHA) protein